MGDSAAIWDLKHRGRVALEHIHYTCKRVSGKVLYSTGRSTRGLVMTWSGGDGVEGGGEGQKRTCVYQWLIPADVWQKPTQLCEVTIPQLKVNKKE